MCVTFSAFCLHLYFGPANETIEDTILLNQFYLMDYRVHIDAKSVELSICILRVWNCLFCILRGCRSKGISVPEVCFLIVKQCRPFMREIAFTYIREYMCRFILVFNEVTVVVVFFNKISLAIFHLKIHKLLLFD